MSLGELGAANLEPMHITALLSVQDPGSISKRLSTDGYSILSNPVEWPVDLRKVEHAVHKLVEAGWPASFVMMFDEPWLLMHSMSELMLKGTVLIPSVDLD